MKLKQLKERGQALILIAFAAFGLFAIAGLAIDGSAKYSDRRHAQNAADTAALTGALAKASNVSQWQLTALSRADDNGYDNDLVTNHVQVNSPPISGIYKCTTPPDVHFNCNDYVQVIIDSTVNTYFARIIGIFQTHNHVEAVASTISANDHFNFGGNAIVALSPTGCALKAGGNTEAYINGGGVYSNSDSTCAFQKTSCAGIFDINNGTGTVTTVGGYTLNGNCMPGANMDPFNTQIPFPPPYQEIAPPAVCSAPYASYPNDKVVTLSPGHYQSMPPKSNMTNVTLNPGIYCIDTELRTNSGDVMTVSGTFDSTPGVFFYFMPSTSANTFTINASSVVHLWGINPASVTSDSSLGPYKGFLIYAAPNYATGNPTNCTINGTALDQISGTIYAPYCNIKLNGSSGTAIESQVIGYTVDLTGASGVTLTYPGSDQVYWNIPLQVGLTK